MTPAQFAAGANKQLEVYSKEKPVDQVGHDKPLLQWFISHKKEAPGGNQYFNEKVHVAYDSNYQNYYGDDQVTYNRRDTVRLAKFPWYNFHDGFMFNEDELAANGITLTDDRNAVVTDAEKIQIYNVMTQNYDDLRDGVQEQFDIEAHLDGTQDAKAAPGLDFLVSTSPQTQTSVGGIDSSLAANSYWRNNTNGPIALSPGGNYTPSILITEMEETWRACTRYGKKSSPDTIMCGSAFYDAYRDAVNATNQRQVIIKEGGTGGPALDGGTSDLYFKGVKVVWNPTFDALDDLLGVITVPWKKRCYFLNSKTIKLRPLPGHWMVNRDPERMYDRYVHFWAMTSKYRFTTSKRNANAVLWIA